MSLRSRPLWYEGQLLRPQHLQHLLRWQEGLLERRLEAISPFAWGIHSLRLDPTLLPLGKVGFEALRGVLPDGTPVFAPLEDPLPEPRAIPPEAAGRRILLAVPARTGDGPEIARFEPRSQPARDTTGEAPVADITIGLPRLSLVIEGEPADDLVTMPVARIAHVEASGTVVLDEGFVPPALRLGAHPLLQAFAREVAAMLAARADALAARVDPSRAGADVAGMVAFSLLQTMNAAEPVFAQLARQPEAPPELLHREALRLAGALATYARSGRRPDTLPDWNHAEPGPPLAAALAAIRNAMSSLATESAVSLPLVERAPGVWVSPITDRALLQGAAFVLAARADTDPERLRIALPAQAKMGPVEVIRDLVNLQLPGIPLRPMPVAPRELPFRSGTVYLELDRSSDLWPRLAASPAFALHIGGEFPGLALEFWAIRQGG
mgnify:CR=1 FL=1